MTDKSSSPSATYDRMVAAVQQLNALCSDPHPGLSTWSEVLHKAKCECVNAILAFEPLKSSAPSETPRSETFLGPCSCADTGKCKHNSDGPLCMQEGTSAASAIGQKSVFAVISSVDYEGDRLEGILATKEEADAAVERLKPENKYIDDWTVQEWKIGECRE